MKLVNKNTILTILSLIVVILLTSGFSSIKGRDLAAFRYTTWLWDTHQIQVNEEETLEFLKQNHVQTVYLQIDQSLRDEFYQLFIEKAQHLGISVYALDGSTEWGSFYGNNAVEGFFDWLENYQKAASPSQSFKGVHFDVEPHLNPSWKIDRDEAIEEYLAFLLRSKQRTNHLGLTFSIDIPFWYDEVTFKNRFGESILAEWVIKNMKHATILAYRNVADGANGIHSLVKQEMNWAQQYHAKLIIAVQTLKSYEGKEVSFFGKTQTKMNKELATVYTHYRSNPAFAGFAVHDLQGWMKLKQ